MKHYDSIETEKLRALIRDKEHRIAKIDNKYIYQQLQGEILFLREEVLPMVLVSSSLVHNSVARYAVKAVDAAIQYGCNELLILHHICDDYKDNPILGVANARENTAVGTPGRILLSADLLDGNGVPLRSINLPINNLI